MGANVYLSGVAAYGYKTESAATAIVQGLQPKAGNRIAIRAYRFTGGAATSTYAYFMQVLGTAELASAIASGGSGVEFDDEPVAANALATADYVGITLDDGTVHFSTVKSGTALAFYLTTVVTGAAAAGNVAYFFGAATDTGHHRLRVTHSVQNSDDLDGGIAYAAGKGYPMIAYHANDAAAAGAIDSIMVDYINK